jgi:hypothetical protein
MLPLYNDLGLIGIRSRTASLIQRNDAIIVAALCLYIPVNYLEEGLAGLNVDVPDECITTRAGRAGFLHCLGFATIEVELVYTFAIEWY